ncbi:MAG: ABC transporter substrate-binding protein [Lachnospiraceae bacterium]|nr:ABC transporter substrate-binding protein [Lachnospiraceae bacterium]
MLLVFGMAAGMLAGCGKKPAEKIDIAVAALKGPTAIGMIQVMENAENKETANNYNFTIAGTADELTTGIVKGEIPIAAVPCNLASVLYNRTGGAVQIAAINTISVLYIVETGETIQSAEDLKGRTIYSTGKGTTPEYTLNYLLRAAGIDPEKDVTIEYKSEATEVAAIMAESEDAVAMLPQPYVTVAMTQNEKLRIALDVAAEWEKYTDDGSSVVTGVVLVNKAFASENKAALDAFLDEYAASVQYVTENVEDAAKLVEKFDIVKAAVAAKAIPYCNIVFLEGEEMRTKVDGYLKVLFDQQPSSVGGELPGEDFYYSR